MKKLILTMLVLFNFEVLSSDYLVSFKLITGSFSYDSEILTGSATTTASPALMIHIPLTTNHLLGVTSEVHVNSSTKVTSLYAIGINYRYYFQGLGSYKTIETAGLKVQTKRKWSSYYSASFSKYSYFLGSNLVDQDKFDQNGSFFNLDMGAGSEYDIGKDYRVFTEFSYTLLSLASSDDRVRIKGTLVSIGIAKDF